MIIFADNKTHYSYADKVSSFCPYSRASQEVWRASRSYLPQFRKPEVENGLVEPVLNACQASLQRACQPWYQAAGAHSRIFAEHHPVSLYRLWGLRGARCQRSLL